ncbi:hypothetical protein CKO15_10900 [Halorhodospira abdelmalekii]|nr:hypothetical protein [Halorhodospira abdelmalekii]
MTLFADALAHWPALYRALQRLQLGGVPLRLLRAVSHPVDGQPQPAPATPLPAFTLRPPAPPSGPIQVVLETPLRLQRNGRLLKAQQFTADTFLTALLRRIESLDADLPAIDHIALARHSRSAVTLRDPILRWQDADRYSSRQGQRVPLGGLVGHFRLEGDLAPIWPLLWVGQWVHTGKSAVMGLGRYRLIEPDDPAEGVLPIRLADSDRHPWRA